MVDHSLKCLGGTPCPHCASLRIQCSYDERLDKRRKAFNEKARAEIDFQRRLLDGLIRAIKSEHAPTVLEMVRQDASLEEIATQLDRMGMLTATPADISEHTNPRAKSYDSEVPISSQTQQNNIATALVTESESFHALSINQLLAPPPQQNQLHQQQLQQQQQRRSSTSPSVSIPSLSEVLIEAQKQRLQDEEQVTTVFLPKPLISSESLPPSQQDRLNGPRLSTFPAIRMDVKSLVSSSAGQPSLSSHPPQDRTCTLTHSHSPILISDPRHSTSPT